MSALLAVFMNNWNLFSLPLNMVWEERKICNFWYFMIHFHLPAHWNRKKKMKKQSRFQIWQYAFFEGMSQRWFSRGKSLIAYYFCTFLYIFISNWFHLQYSLGRLNVMEIMLGKCPLLPIRCCIYVLRSRLFWMYL